MLQSTSVSQPDSRGFLGGSGCTLCMGTWQCWRMPVLLGSVGGLYRAEFLHCIFHMRAA